MFATAGKVQEELGSVTNRQKIVLMRVARQAASKSIKAAARSLVGVLCIVLPAIVDPSWPVRSQQINAPSKSQPQEVAAQKSTLSDVSDGSYRIGPGDVLDIRVFNRPQLSREAVRVDGRGMITMPLMGELHAACKPEKQLAAEIEIRYLDWLKKPEVDVFIKEYNSKPVAVIGAVNSPGQFQLKRQVRLLELITFAGGPQDRAGTVVQVIHMINQSVCEGVTSSASGSDTAVSDENNLVDQIDLRDMRSGSPQANPFARPGDIVIVSEAPQVYIVGNVLRPSAIPLKEQVTVTQAIAMAGGLMPDTRKENVRIIRRAPGSGQKTEIQIDLKAIEKRQAEDIAVQANDIIDVPASGSKRFLRSLLGTVVPTISQLPVRVIP